MGCTMIDVTHAPSARTALLAALVAAGLCGCIDRGHGVAEADAGRPDPGPVEPPCVADGCDDGNPCTDDRCEPTFGCVFQPHLRPCDDGDRCTTGDQCRAGACVGGAPTVCDDGDRCTTDACEPDAGCVSRPLPAGTWVSARVDGIGEVGRYGDLVVDDGGTLHVAYWDTEVGALRYGRRPAGGGWTTERIGDERAGLYSVAALGPEGRIHLASLDRNDRMMLATPAEEGWHITWHAPVEERFIDLDVDLSGRPFLTFIGPGDRVYLGTPAPGEGRLDVERVPLGAAERTHPTLRIDRARGLMYLVSRRLGDADESGIDLAVRPLEGGPWQVEEVAAHPAVLWRGRRALAIDGAGRLHLAFTADGALRYGVRESGGWRIESPLGDTPLAQIALGLDSAGRPLIAWSESRGSTLHALIREADGGWRSEEVARRPGPPASLASMHQTPSAVFDPLTLIWHMTYYDVVPADLRHAWRCD